MRGQGTLSENRDVKSNEPFQQLNVNSKQQNLRRYVHLNYHHERYILLAINLTFTR
jgi:hypothetical protein